MLPHKMGRLHVETCDDKAGFDDNFRDDIRDYKRGRLRLIHAMHALTSNMFRRQSVHWDAWLLGFVVDTVKLL